MEDPLGSLFSYHQESTDDLKQKLLDTTFELETMKNVKTELFNLLKMACQERDEARDQLQKLVNKLLPSTPTTHDESQLQNMFVEVQPPSLLMLPTSANKANSSITESNSLSHGSSAVDSFFDTVSSPEFSNINVVDSNNNNLGYLSQTLVQGFNVSSPSPSPALFSSEKPTSDPETAVIDYLAKGKVLPQKGKLLQAVMEAGPLLQTLLLAGGPLPSWRNPPPLQAIKVPPFIMKDFDNPSSFELNSFASTGNSFQKPTLQSSSHSVLNFAGNSSGSRNNVWQLTSNAVSVENHAPPRSRKRRQ